MAFFYYKSISNVTFLFCCSLSFVLFEIKTKIKMKIIERRESEAAYAIHSIKINEKMFRQMKLFCSFFFFFVCYCCIALLVHFTFSSSSSCSFLLVLLCLFMSSIVETEESKRQCVIWLLHSNSNIKIEQIKKRWNNHNGNETGG